MLSDILSLIRIKQWIKNVFVLAPLVFVGKFTDIDAITQSLQAFLLFCMASSVAYIFNDIKDLSSDKKHKVKSKTRPLASGRLSVGFAYILLGVLYASIAAFGIYMPEVFLVIAGYLALNIAYSFYFKHQPVLDIFSIAIGFVLRVYAGAVALNVPLSPWMLITTLCLALYLASIKRLQELSANGEKARGVLEKYSASLITRYAQISASGAIIFYSLFVVTVRPELVLTIPFVLFGIFRYWYLVEGKGEGEYPTEIIYKDIPLIITILSWIALCVFMLKP